MPITRDPSNSYLVKDWTDDIVNLPVLEGMMNAMGLFEERSTSQTAIIFEKDNRNYSLLPQTSRTQRNASVGSDRTSEIFSLALPYFKHQDAIFPTDVQGQREYGDPDGAKSLAKAISTKVEDMRIRGDQTKDYMKWEAIKGNTVDSEGNTIADMFTEFGLTQDEVDFVLGTSTTNISGKINEVLRTVAANNKSGVAASMPIIVCGNSFFDKLIVHADVVQAYSQYSQDDGVQRLRDNLVTFREWGAVATFRHRGVMFVNYEPSYTNHLGSTLTPIGTDDGYVLLPNARDLYRGYNGPANKLTGANQPGAPMFLYQYAHPKDEGMDFELEMSPLYFMTNPKMSIKVTTSN